MPERLTANRQNITTRSDQPRRIKVSEIVKTDIVSANRYPRLPEAVAHLECCSFTEA